MMKSIFEIALIMLGGVAIFVMPGYVISFIAFGRGKVDFLERIALGFALSITAVPLLAFYLSILGVRPSPWSITIEVIAITSLAAVIAYWRGNFKESYVSKI